MFPNPPKQFSAKISALKISTQNLWGRKEESGFLFASQTLQRVCSHTDGRRRWWLGAKPGKGGGVKKPQRSPVYWQTFLLTVSSLRPGCWRNRFPELTVSLAQGNSNREGKQVRMDQRQFTWVSFSPFFALVEGGRGGEGGVLPPGEYWNMSPWQVLGLKPGTFLSDNCLLRWHASLQNLVVGWQTVDWRVARTEIEMSKSKESPSVSGAYRGLFSIPSRCGPAVVFLAPQVPSRILAAWKSFWGGSLFCSGEWLQGLPNSLQNTTLPEQCI